MAAIQVKHVPEDLHAAARERAAQRGQSLGEYLLELLRRDLQRPRWEVWAERHAAARQAAALGTDAPSGWSSAEAVRAARAEREAELDERFQRLQEDRP